MRHAWCNLGLAVYNTARVAVAKLRGSNPNLERNGEPKLAGGVVDMLQLAIAKMFPDQPYNDRPQDVVPLRVGGPMSNLLPQRMWLVKLQTAMQLISKPPNLPAGALSFTGFNARHCWQVVKWTQAMMNGTSDESKKWQLRHQRALSDKENVPPASAGGRRRRTRPRT